MITLELQLLWVRHWDPCTIRSHSFQHPLVIHRMYVAPHLELVQALSVHIVPFHRWKWNIIRSITFTQTVILIQELFQKKQIKKWIMPAAHSSLTKSTFMSIIRGDEQICSLIHLFPQISDTQHKKSCKTISNPQSKQDLDRMMFFKETSHPQLKCDT